MPSTVRISSRGHKLLGELARQTGSTMTDILDAALEGYRRQQFLQQANAAYSALSTNPSAWASYREDMDSLEGTLADGLDLAL